MFQLRAHAQSLTVESRDLLVSGTAEVYHCQFTFDKAWEGTTRTAVFTAGETSVVQALDGQDHCIIPQEVLACPDVRLQIGIYGVRGESRMPTIEADVGRIFQGAELSDEAAQLTQPLFAQLLAAIGPLGELDTEEKENLVAAINEVASNNGSFGGYYEPLVTCDGDIMTIAYSPSRENMPPVAPVEVLLPLGPEGPTGPMGPEGPAGPEGLTPQKEVDYWTAEDRTRILEELAEVCLPVPVSAAAIGQVLKVAAVDENGKVTAVSAEDLPEYANLDEVSF